MQGERERESLKRVKDYLFCHKEKQFNLMMENLYKTIESELLK